MLTKEEIELEILIQTEEDRYAKQWTLNKQIKQQQKELQELKQERDFYKKIIKELS